MTATYGVEVSLGKAAMCAVRDKIIEEIIHDSSETKSLK
jgi:hypothetical protein